MQRQSRRDSLLMHGAFNSILVEPAHLIVETKLLDAISEQILLPTLQFITIFSLGRYASLAVKYCNLQIHAG